MNQNKFFYNDSIDNDYKWKFIYNFFDSQKYEFFIFWFLIIFLILYQIYSFQRSKIIKIIVYFSIFHAIFIEYIALYYEAIAKRTNSLNQGIPDSCLNQSKYGLFKKFSIFLQNTFTFQNDDCQIYYRNLFVLPIFDVSLLDAISKVFKKFIFSYFTDISHTIGNSIYLLLYKFPIQWQFVIFISMLFLIIIFLFLLFRIELTSLFFTIKFNRPSLFSLQSSDSTIKSISNFNKNNRIQYTPIHQHSKLKRSYSFSNFHSESNQNQEFF